MARILIAGAGRLGSLLGILLAGEGHRVYGLRRDAGRLPQSITPMQADLTAPDSLTGLPVVDRVVFAAAAGESSEQAYRRIYLDGLGNLVRALSSQSRPPGLLFVSSTAVYEVDDGSPVHEATPCRPEGFRGRVLLEAESLAMSAPGPTTVIRLAGLYGPGPGALVDRVRRGGPCSAGRFTNRIHVTDAAGALAHLLQPEAGPGLYVAADDAPALQCEVMDWLAGRIGARRPPRESRPGGRGKRCLNRRLRESGYRFRYPDYRAGYDAILSGAET